ncbi:MAG: hypothetical protein B5M53_00725 [Candidatus Cloacimonas sp. 4484_209]|nr:MAG: hypothetical protein B5M53_00725 [Candidatus Cloacimonas sp. 4484_209]
MKIKFLIILILFLSLISHFFSVNASSIEIWTDRDEYCLGDPLIIYYRSSDECNISIILHPVGETFGKMIEIKHINGNELYTLKWKAYEPASEQELVIDSSLGDTAYCRFFVIDCSQPPTTTPVPTTTPAPTGRFSVSKPEYKQGKAVEMYLESTGATPIQLPNTAPWTVFRVEGGFFEMYKPAAAEVITEVPEHMSWTWNQKDNLGESVPEGNYRIILRTLNAGEYSASFTITGEAAPPTTRPATTSPPTTTTPPTTSPYTTPSSQSGSFVYIGVFAGIIVLLLVIYQMTRKKPEKIKEKWIEKEPKKEVIVEKPSKHCPFCGKLISLNVTICPYCKKSLEITPELKRLLDEEKKWKEKLEQLKANKGKLEEEIYEEKYNEIMDKLVDIKDKIIQEKIRKRGKK